MDGGQDVEKGPVFAEIVRRSFEVRGHAENDDVKRSNDKVPERVKFGF